MKVLSLDIGINNLSYCILSYDNGNYNIQEWDILNVNPYENDNKEIASLNKQIDKDNKKKLKDEGESSKLKKKKLKKKPTLNELSEKIINTFDNNSIFLDCNYVIIENQPCLKNPTMKSIQMIVYSYFYIRGIVDNKSIILKDIVFISAGNKLKVYDGPNIEVNLSTKYARNKKLAIFHTKYLLKNHSEYLSFFESNKKKDDLADSFLQAAYFLKFKLKTNLL